MRTLLYFISRLAISCPLLLLGCGDSGGGGTATCGNGAVEGTEQCDDGNTDSGDGCDFECFVEGATCGDDVIEGREECEGADNCFPPGHVDGCTVPRRAFRWNDFGLLDPKIYQATGCAEFVHGLLADTLKDSTKGDKSATYSPDFALDGVIDLGFVLTFRELAQGNGESSPMDFVVSDCVPLAPSPDKSGGPTPCAPTAIQPANSASFTVTSQTSGTCLAAIPDTTDFPEAGDRVVTAGEHGCFVNDDPVDVTVGLGTVVKIPLKDVRIAGQWNATPATGILDGFVYGFLTEEDAAAQIIDVRTPLVSGQDLATTLSPLEGCDHRDEGPDGEGGTTTGWWVYFPFAAEEVPWKGGLACGDGDLDAGSDEVCDPGIASGENNACGPLLECAEANAKDVLCLDECDDGTVCTIDTANVGDPCAPTCFHKVFNQLPGEDGDGCCPVVDAPQSAAGSRSAADPDCVTLCGNDVLESFESCEIGDETKPCDIPESCDDENACTEDFITKPGLFGKPVPNVCISCTAGQQFPCICGHSDIPGCTQ